MHICPETDADSRRGSISPGRIMVTVAGCNLRLLKSGVKKLS